jgi:hypothetical protein
MVYTSGHDKNRLGSRQFESIFDAPAQALPCPSGQAMAAIAGLAKFKPFVWRKMANLFIENAIGLRSSSIRTTHIQG